MTILRRISRALARFNGGPGSGGGSSQGPANPYPGVRYVEGAERAAFPPEEFATGEDVVPEGES